MPVVVPSNAGGVLTASNAGGALTASNAGGGLLPLVPVVVYCL